MHTYAMEVVDLPLTHIHVGLRKRPVDAKAVQDIAQSIERQGLLQPIGVKVFTDDTGEPSEDDQWEIVFGAHRLAAYVLLQRETIEARILPDELPGEEYLLIELQENSARNDLSKSQRKAYMAEAGQLLAKLHADGNIANGNINWLNDLAKTTNVAQRTAYNWWHIFCEETARALTPGQALEPDRNDFFAWLKAHQAAEEAEKARKDAEAFAQRRRKDLDDELGNLAILERDYGRATVITEVINVFLGPGEPA
jgi:ParB/RepB/Spo0J family partition protein